MKLRHVLTVGAALLLSACAVTMDILNYTYTPPGADDPKATLSYVEGKAKGDMYLQHVAEDGCAMGSTKILSRSTYTETIHAEKPVFIYQRFVQLRGNGVCTVQFAFTPKDKGVYKIGSEMNSSSCFSKLYEVTDAGMTEILPRGVVYSKADRMSCQKMAVR